VSVNKHEPKIPKKKGLESFRRIIGKASKKYIQRKINQAAMDIMDLPSFIIIPRQIIAIND